MSCDLSKKRVNYFWTLLVRKELILQSGLLSNEGCFRGLSINITSIHSSSFYLSTCPPVCLSVCPHCRCLMNSVCMSGLHVSQLRRRRCWIFPPGKTNTSRSANKLLLHMCVCSPVQCPLDFSVFLRFSITGPKLHPADICLLTSKSH